MGRDQHYFLSTTSEPSHSLLSGCECPVLSQTLRPWASCSNMRIRLSGPPWQCLNPPSSEMKQSKPGQHNPKNSATSTQWVYVSAVHLALARGVLSGTPALALQQWDQRWRQHRPCCAHPAPSLHWLKLAGMGEKEGRMWAGHGREGGWARIRP